VSINETLLRISGALASPLWIGVIPDRLAHSARRIDHDLPVSLDGNQPNRLVASLSIVID
jgi:hypothetical protein